MIRARDDFAMIGRSSSASGSCKFWSDEQASLDSVVLFDLIKPVLLRKASDS